MSHPIPKGLRAKFTAHMEAHDFDHLPDGAWFQTLVDAAQSFMTAHDLTKPWHCANTAAHRYLAAKATGGQA